MTTYHFGGREKSKSQMTYQLLGLRFQVTCISGSATTNGLSNLSPNARDTARTPPTRHVPGKFRNSLEKFSMDTSTL